MVGTRLRASKSYFKPALSGEVMYTLKSYPRELYFPINRVSFLRCKQCTLVIGTSYSILPVFPRSLTLPSHSLQEHPTPHPSFPLLSC